MMITTVNAAATIAAPNTIIYCLIHIKRLIKPCADILAALISLIYLFIHPLHPLSPNLNNNKKQSSSFHENTCQSTTHFDFTQSPNEAYDSPSSDHNNQENTQAQLETMRSTRNIPKQQQISTQKQSVNFPWSDDREYCLCNIRSNYIIGECIGQGTYSKVFSAISSRDNSGKLYAIKRSKYQDSNDCVRCIESERMQSVHSGLQCYLIFNDFKKNEIISIWDCHRSTLHSALPMLSLFDDCLKTKECMISGIICKILIKLVDLHVHGNIIHHDLKGDNILISDECGNIFDPTKFDIFIIDYGFSKNCEYGSDCESGNAKIFPKHTFAYCAWELLDCVNRENVKYSHSIDLYALGMICFKLLCSSDPNVLDEVLFDGNEKRNEFIARKTNEKLNERGIDRKKQLQYPSQFKYFVKCLEVRYHREFYTKNNGSSAVSVISDCCIAHLKGIGYSNECLDFVSKLLHCDPNKRINARNALKHPFIFDN